jgi:murein DD-endopeptidase MepM/ murein hydrolase activator NlpD
VAAAPPDATPPVLTPSVTGTPGANGWYVSPVSVEWSVLDPESGVPDFSGCEPRTLGDTAGTTITCSATNGAGLGASVSVTAKVDTTPPLVGLAVVSGTPGTNGWYVSDVLVRTQGADAVSGIVSCTPDHLQTAETTGTVLQGSCVNGAGLVGQAAPLTLRIDETPPDLTASRSPQPNAAGWNNTDVTVTFSCQDAVSGVSEPPQSPQVVTTEGAGQSVSADCVDAAGHAATATVDGISIDKTAPAVVISSPEAGEYLREARVPMSWSVTESLSGLDSERGRLDRRTVANGQVVSLKSIGKGSHTLEVVASDVAGNSGTAAVTFQVLSSLPHARHVDWPLGTCTGAELVLGLDVDVVQNYGNTTHPVNAPRAHAGLDLKLRGGSSALVPVYAAADGVFQCDNAGPGDARPDYPGRALVLKHKMADGGTVYTQYGHLDEVLVRPGRVVRRGDLIGHVLDQDAAGETHLHFEVRKFASWDEDDCAGPGYAPQGSTPKQHRWLDPVPFYYTHRPSLPAMVITWSHPDPLPLRSRPRADATALGSLPPSSRVSVLDVAKDDGCRSEDKCSEWWYKLRDASGRRVFVRGFHEGDYGSALTVGEPRRTGAQWSPSSGRLLVDYRFDDPVDFAQGVVVNEASPGRRDGRILGEAELVDGEGGDADKALRLDGATAYVEVEDSQHLRFRDGIGVEALVSRESGSTEDAVASQGSPDGPWRLALSPEGKLAFEVRFEDGGRARLEHRIAACDDLGLWVHVAARWDPRDGIRLFWNGSQVAKDGSHGKRLVRPRGPIRIGDAGGPATRLHGRIDSVRIRELDRPHDDDDDDDDDDDHDDHDDDCDDDS